MNVYYIYAKVITPMFGGNYTHGQINICSTYGPDAAEKVVEYCNQEGGNPYPESTPAIEALKEYAGKDALVIFGKELIK